VGDDEPPALRGTLDRAAAETRTLGHHYIGSEHLLLALLGAVGSRAAQRLHAAGARHDQIRGQIVRIVGVGDEETANQQILPFTENAIAVVRRIRKEAERAGPEAIGTEHILRAVLRRRDSLAVLILKECAVDTRELADELRRARPDEGY
jgi:ATP-dependent Clp protease ATP-binding subunit ClpC